MIGFLLQWPTLPTLAIFPILVFVYRRLANAEEREIRARFGEAWDAYASRTPRFIPKLGAAAEAIERKEDRDDHRDAA
jgi:protein-S-isoprenylcysteine O-methyltransferase Ste14